MSYTLPNLAATLDYARSSLVEIDDFIGASPISTSSPFSLRASGAGAGASHAALIGDNSPGVVELTTGTTSSGEATLTGGYNAGISSTNGSILRFASGIQTVFEARVQLDSLATNGVEEFDVYVGLGLASISYARFRYNVDTSANWTVENDDTGGSATTTTSGTVVAAGTWYRMRAVVSGVTNVQYYLNDSLVATHTTNLPGSATPGVSIVKSVGTSAAILRVDYIAVAQYGLSR